MRKIITSIGIAALILSSAAACDSTKKVSEEGQVITEVSAERKATMEKAGFTAGTIVYSDKEQYCEYTIMIEGGTLFDPTNLADDYKKDGLQVFFKFRGLRMPNRCGVANPILIEKMEKQ